MRRSALHHSQVLFAGLLVIVGGDRILAQEHSVVKWPDEAQIRLKQIYEQDEFRAKQFKATWLADSSGYTVLQRDPDTRKTSVLRYEVETGEQSILSPEEASKLETRRNRSPDGASALEIRDRKVFVRNRNSGRRIPLTEDASDRDLRFQKLSWSPDGKRIAFIESDQSNVRLRPVLEPTDPSYPSVQQRRFARVGETIARLRIGVANADGSDTQWLPVESPKEGFYLGQVEWAGNSHELLVEWMSRFRDRREFLLFDLVTGNSKTIFSESDPAWSVGSQEKNLGLTWIRSGNAFIVVSEKDGWRHAFLCSRDGEELGVLTPGEYDIIDRAFVDEQRGWYYFYASPDNGTQQYLFRAPLDGSGTLEKVTPESQPGTHRYEASPNARWAFHTRSRFDLPPITTLVELPEHRVVRELEDNSELRKKMKRLDLPKAEFLQLDLGAGVTMDAWMIKPKNLDLSKKYPVLVYVYGEPYAQTVLDDWGSHHADFHRLIADLGYVVVSIDNRGTPAPKGAAWRRSIFGSLGPLSTRDQAAGLKELAHRRLFVDLHRVAIWGWSGGGSNTLNALFREPDLYSVGIAVVPKPQPSLYNAWFQEIYMRTREVNREGYESAAPINFAEGLKGKLLIITGSGETNTHIQIVEGLVDRLIELGKRFDYMVYPNRDHGLRKGRGTSVHLRMLMARYLLDNLQPGPR